MANGFTEVARGGPAYEVDILGEQGPVKSQLGPKEGQILVGGIKGQHQCSRVARQANQHKDDQ